MLPLNYYICILLCNQISKSESIREHTHELHIWIWFMWEIYRVLDRKRSHIFTRGLSIFTVCVCVCNFFVCLFIYFLHLIHLLWMFLGIIHFLTINLFFSFIFAHNFTFYKFPCNFLGNKMLKFMYIIPIITGEKHMITGKIIICKQELSTMTLLMSACLYLYFTFT